MSNNRRGQIGQFYAQNWAKTTLFPAFLMLFGGIYTPTAFSFFQKKEQNGGGTIISVGEMKAKNCIYTVLPNFDFDAKCEVVSYTVVRVVNRGDPMEWPNKGSKFSAEVAQNLMKVKSGDHVYFDDIKCLCPGDNVTRNLGSLAFSIR
jgi:co-chaperonin GroES (HSP10)